MSVLALLMQETVREIAVSAPPRAESAPVITGVARRLSTRQRAVLRWIDEFIAKNSFPPTIREIGAGVGIRSTNGVNDHLRALQRRGAIALVPSVSRGIRLIREAS